MYLKGIGYEHSFSDYEFWTYVLLIDDKSYKIKFVFGLEMLG